MACGNDYDPVDASLAEGADQLAFALGVLVAAAGEDEDAALARGVLDGAMERGRERVRDVLENEPDRLCLASKAAQRRGVYVAPVVELVDRPPHLGLNRKSTRLNSSHP